MFSVEQYLTLEYMLPIVLVGWIGFLVLAVLEGSITECIPGWLESLDRTVFEQLYFIQVSSLLTPRRRLGS